MTDWKKLYEEWSSVSPELQQKIFDAFLKKTPDQLKFLFLREPYAKLVWMKIPEEKRLPPKPPVVPPIVPKPPVVAPPPPPPVEIPKVPVWKLCPVHNVEMLRETYLPIRVPALREMPSEVQEWLRQHLVVRAPPTEPKLPPVEMLNIPETMEVYYCPAGDHYLERIDDKVAERSLSFLYRKIERERRRVERLIAPPMPPALRPPTPAEMMYLKPRRPILPKFEEWLVLEKGLEMWQYVKLSEDEKKRFLDEYDNYLKGMLEEE